jgi:hypothetical protein
VLKKGIFFGYRDIGSHNEHRTKAIKELLRMSEVFFFLDGKR